MSFPQDQAVGCVEAVTVLKTEDSSFRKRTVVDLDRRLIRSEILKRFVDSSILDIVKHGMPVTERSSFGILSGQAHTRAFSRKCRKCKRLTGRPVQRAFAARHLAPGANA